jgi:hypothetical protein
MVPSGILRRVALARTNVSEKLSASFIRVTRFGELGTTLAVNSYRRTLRRNTKYAMAPRGFPAKDFPCGVETAIGILPEETAEEIRQETVRILKGSRQPKNNLTGAKRRVLRSFRANASLRVLPADKGNAAMVLGTSDYKKIATLPQEKAYTSKYDQRIPGHLGFMGCRRFTYLMCH